MKLQQPASTGRCPSHRVAVIVLALLALLPGVAAQVGAAQDGTPAPGVAGGYRLVARMLPAEWGALAETTTGFAEATPGGADGGSDPSTTLSGAALLSALRRGGYVIYFRHAATDFSQADSDRQNLADCSTQRNLNDEGRDDARAIGAAFRALGIPVGDVLSSEYCRTRETAELAFGRVTPTRDLTSRASTATPAERAERIEALRRLLATPPAPGLNTVLVGHLFNLQDATGVSIAEGEAAIFLPLGDGTAAATPAAGG